MLKRKRDEFDQTLDKIKEIDDDASKQSSTTTSKQDAIAAKKLKRSEHRDVSSYMNKQRCLVISSRGTSFQHRHLLNDLRDLIPHSKQDVKIDTKDNLSLINEICDLKSCNTCIYFEARKHSDLYMWCTSVPTGPSFKFLVQNIHTMAEVKLTGNALKNSRPFLVFDGAFDQTLHYKLMKQELTALFNAPKGHPKVKPFIDHVMSFAILDSRIWVRHYQISYQHLNEDGNTKKLSKETANPNKVQEPLLIEIGPRFVLNPIKILQSSMEGAVIWENPSFQSPNLIRKMDKLEQNSKFESRQVQRKQTKEHQLASKLQPNAIDVFDE